MTVKIRPPRMRLYRGDIWDKIRLKYEVVIPVNIGWKKSGHNIMGRGLAKQALERYPAIAMFLGELQNALWTVERPPMGDPRWITKWPFGPLTFFPTKPLYEEKPWMSWSQPSDREMIKNLLPHLPAYADRHGLERIAVPVLGAGNGGLDFGDMVELIRSTVSDSRFVLVTPF